MNKPNFTFYAIKIKGTESYKSGRHTEFGSFNDAMANGTFFNTTKNAERSMNDTLKRINGHKNNDPTQSFYTVSAGDGLPEYFSGFQHIAEKATLAHPEYPVIFKPLELEIVTLTMSAD